MASIVAKRPVVGVAAGIIFAALGSLLISVEGTQPGIAGVLSGLYKVAGYFLLMVACLSVVAGAAGIWSMYRSRRCREADQATK
jgi:hypothetical protein